MFRNFTEHLEKLINNSYLPENYGKQTQLDKTIEEYFNQQEEKIKGRSYGVHKAGLKETLTKYFEEDNNRVGIMNLAYENTSIDELTIQQIIDGDPMN